MISELQKHQLVTTHLNLSKGSRPERSRDRDTRAHVASVSGPKYCYGFQRGSCTRPDCPFLHEKDPSSTRSATPSSRGRAQANMASAHKPKPGSHKKGRGGGGGRGGAGRGGRNQKGSNKKGKPPSDQKCFRCGSPGHLAPECKFEGTCDYCKKKGHKSSTCLSKKHAEKPAAAARVIFADEEEVDDVAVRFLTVENEAQGYSFSSLPMEGDSSWDCAPGTVFQNPYVIARGGLQFDCIPPTGWMVCLGR